MFNEAVIEAQHYKEMKTLRQFNNKSILLHRSYDEMDVSKSIVTKADLLLSIRCELSPFLRSLVNTFGKSISRKLQRKTQVVLFTCIIDINENVELFRAS